jgi:RNA polymerase sigma factor (sigma-70 family)
LDEGPVIVLRSSRHIDHRWESGVKSRNIGTDDAHESFHAQIVPLLDSAYSFARYLSRDADAAQDIVQDAFLRAYRSFGGYRGGNARAWLFTIVRNCYLGSLQNRRRTSRLSGDAREEDGSDVLEVASQDDTPEEALLRKGESEAVQLAIATLPRRLREVIILREIEELSYSQIAEVTSLPIGTVMSRLSRARRKFEEAWRGHAPMDRTIAAE